MRAIALFPQFARVLLKMVADVFRDWDRVFAHQGDPARPGVWSLLEVARWSAALKSELAKGSFISQLLLDVHSYYDHIEPPQLAEDIVMLDVPLRPLALAFWFQLAPRFLQISTIGG